MLNSCDSSSNVDGSNSAQEPNGGKGSKIKTSDLMKRLREINERCERTLLASRSVLAHSSHSEADKSPKATPKGGSQVQPNESTSPSEKQSAAGGTGESPKATPEGGLQIDSQKVMEENARLISAVIAQRDEAASRAKTLEQKVDSLEKELTSTKAKLAEKSREMQETTQELLTYMSEDETKKENLIAQTRAVFRKKGEEKKELEGKLQSETDQRKALEEQLDGLKDEMEKLRVDSQRLNESSNERQGEIKSLREQLAEKEQEANAKAERISELEQGTKSQGKAIKERDKIIDQQRDSLSKKEEEENACKIFSQRFVGMAGVEELRSVEVNTSAITGEIKNSKFYSKMPEWLKDLFSFITGKINSLIEKIKVLTQRVSDLETQNSELEKENQTLKQKIDTLTVENARKQDQNKQLVTFYRKQQAELEEVNEQVADLGTQLEGEQKARQAAETMVAELKGQNQTLERQNAEQKEQLEAEKVKAAEYNIVKGNFHKAVKIVALSALETADSGEKVQRIFALGERIQALEVSNGVKGWAMAKMLRESESSEEEGILRLAEQIDRLENFGEALDLLKRAEPGDKHAGIDVIAKRIGEMPVSDKLKISILLFALQSESQEKREGMFALVEKFQAQAEAQARTQAKARTQAQSRGRSGSEPVPAPKSQLDEAVVGWAVQFINYNFDQEERNRGMTFEMASDILAAAFPGKVKDFVLQDPSLDVVSNSRLIRLGKGMKKKREELKKLIEEEISEKFGKIDTFLRNTMRDFVFRRKLSNSAVRILGDELGLSDDEKANISIRDLRSKVVGKFEADQTWVDNTLKKLKEEVDQLEKGQTRWAQVRYSTDQKARLPGLRNIISLIGRGGTEGVLDNEIRKAMKDQADISKVSSELQEEAFARFDEAIPNSIDLGKTDQEIGESFDQIDPVDRIYPDYSQRVSAVCEKRAEHFRRQMAATAARPLTYYCNNEKAVDAAIGKIKSDNDLKNFVNFIFSTLEDLVDHTIDSQFLGFLISQYDYREANAVMGMVMAEMVSFLGGGKTSPLAKDEIWQKVGGLVQTSLDNLEAERDKISRFIAGKFLVPNKNQCILGDVRMRLGIQQKSNESRFTVGDFEKNFANSQVRRDFECEHGDKLRNIIFSNNPDTGIDATNTALEQWRSDAGKAIGQIIKVNEGVSQTRAKIPRKK